MEIRWSPISDLTQPKRQQTEHSLNLILPRCKLPKNAYKQMGSTAVVARAEPDSHGGVSLQRFLQTLGCAAFFCAHSDVETCGIA